VSRKPAKAPVSLPRGRAVPTLPCPGLLAARLQAGHRTAEGAAAALGVPGSRWRKWEERGRAPQLELERLALEWGVALDTLTTAPDEEAELLAGAIELQRAATALSERVRRFLSRRT
jgi:hypothetical protein